MSELISPAHFDVIVISSGLPEVLIASALARAGKAVLVLDPTEGYGSSWASHSGADFVQLLLNRSLQHQQQQQLQQQDQSQQPPLNSHAQPGDGCGTTHVCQEQLQGVQDCSLYTCPTLEQALDNKGLIIDLAPRVLFQDEPLVQLLVSCQAHHYLEFKLVEGNYLLRHGQLQPVPASRAALFADRSLSLADKRSLGRFMAGCVEAAEGSGRLKDAFDGRPLAELLDAEGLDEQLQQVVLYGIAMADVPQQQHARTQPQPLQQEAALSQQQQQHTTLQQQQQGPVGAGMLAAAPPAATGAPTAPPYSQQAADTAGTVTAAEGLASFVLYSQSIGRYGGPGPFMAPCYGCGSLTEAFVRLAAVKGAVTALRQPTQQLRLLPQEEQQAAQRAAARKQQQQQQQAQQQQQQHSGSDLGPAGAQAGDGVGPSSQTPAAVDASGPTATAPPRVGVTLASGQTLTAGWVVSSCSTTSSSNPNSSSSSSSGPTAGGSVQQGVTAARAVALLDRSLVEGDTSLLLVMPPGTLGPQQRCVIRGLQLGHALAVAPPGHCLLYLSAVLLPEYALLPETALTTETTQGILSGQQGVQCSAACAEQQQAAVPTLAGASAGGSSNNSSTAGCCVFGMGSLAEQVLAPALAALANTQQLQGLNMPGSGPQQQGRQQGSKEEGQQQMQQEGEQEHQEGQQEQQQREGEQQERAIVVQPRGPQVLAACFWTERGDSPLQQQQQQEGSASAGSSEWVLQCPRAPVANFTGYTASIKVAEALFRHHFPGVPWLTDPLPQPTVSPAAAAATAAAGAEGGAGDGAATDTAAGQQGANAAAAATAAATAAAASNGGVSDDEQDAIDELTAALMELSSGLGEGGPGQAGTQL